ncbi:MAG: hypothetical protein OEV67_06610 [Betaproteobacteria bacterium]|jgi:hypothetical protein|nr:hypothetical protein [Betaproteobacteria bacterium]MDH4292873.1 hypothetical protein [Betaproteobacteria bacterium]
MQPETSDTRSARFDVTNQVDTTDPVSVSFQVAQIYEELYHREFPSKVLRVFADVDRLYRGEFPGYHACETKYHDIQHILEVTLAMARLMDGSVRATSPLVMNERLFQIGTVSALFHDIGYLRRLDDTQKKHGAEYTRTHVGRGAEFMAWYLPEAGLSDLADPAARIVHFTGYEMQVSQIQIEPQYRMVGNLLGSADILAQMSDRCYLEKCRDRLYPEFVLGGIARQVDDKGEEKVVFASPADLIFKTPGFFEGAHKRLEQDLGGVYRYVGNYFEGENLYDTVVRKNIDYARAISDAGDISLLRRSLPESGTTEAA